MQAAADLIVEDGLEALNLGEVVERAGVSRRTLYNHFDSRDVLLAEIGRWSDEMTVEQGAALRPKGLDSLPELVSALWKSWQAQGTVFRAMSQIVASSSESGVTESRKQRRAALAQAILDVTSELTPDQAHELAAVFHAFTSAPVYERLTSEDGLGVERAGSLVGWVLGVLRDELAAGNSPFEKEEQQ